MSVYKRYETDKGLEDNGAWVDFGDGISLRLRRYKSATVQEEKRRAERPYRNILDRGEQLPNDVAKKILTDQMVNAIVVDWKGVTDREGEPLPYSKDAARQVFTDLEDFLMEVLGESTDRDRFKRQAHEDAAKN